MKLEGRVVADGLEFPEGPIALPDGAVLVVEIAGGRLTHVSPDGRKRTIADLGGGPNGAAIGPDGKCYVCNNGGFTWSRDDRGMLRPTGRAPDYVSGRIEQVDIGTGVSTVLYDRCGDDLLKGPNDLVFDKQGGFWFTDCGRAHGRTMDRGAVYYARTDGSLIKEAIFPIMTPNGIGLSPDGGTLYVTETETCRLWSFPILGEGELAREPWPSPHGGRLVHGLPGYRRFDSLAVEAGGAVCVATMVHGGINVFSPSGELLEFWEGPEVYCTNICFGGRDMRKAFITLSGSGRLIEVDWPRPGAVLHGALVPSPAG